VSAGDCAAASTVSTIVSKTRAPRIDPGRAVETVGRATNRRILES
jgi:hypothetical protein